MQADVVPLISGLLIFLASLLSLRLGISVAIIEILLGIAAGNAGMQPEQWMSYLASFGGIVLTFLAGAEVDIGLMRLKLRDSLLIGGLSFLLPLLAGFAFCFYMLGWSLSASMLAGIGLSANSIAVVYSVLVETGLNKTEVGKLIMASTFCTNIGTALALSIVFLQPSVNTLVFLAVSVLILVGAYLFSSFLFGHERVRNKVIEPEIKYIFLLLLVLIYFSQAAGSQAILPAFILGLLLSSHISNGFQHSAVKTRLRTVAYALITPFFFFCAGLRVSGKLVLEAFMAFVALFGIKETTKFIGAYVPSKKCAPEACVYVSLLMSTGLTFGTIAAVFGLNQGIVNVAQFSVLIAVEVASAIIPTVISEKWFRPMHAEDVVEIDGNGVE